MSFMHLALDPLLTWLFMIVDGTGVLFMFSPPLSLDTPDVLGECCLWIFLCLFTFCEQLIISLFYCFQWGIHLFDRTTPISSFVCCLNSTNEGPASGTKLFLYFRMREPETGQNWQQPYLHNLHEFVIDEYINIPCSRFWGFFAAFIIPDKQ